MSRLVRRYWSRFPPVRAVLAERDAAIVSAQAMRAERDRALSEHDNARAAEHMLRGERDTAVAERDAARAAEQAVRAECDAALVERDAAIAFAQAMRAERDRALSERDEARAAEHTLRGERDAALAERDDARAAEETASADCEAMAAELAALRSTLPSQPAGEIQDRFRLAAEPRLPGGGRAIIVPVHGPIASREIRVTQPFFERYCRDIGADLRIVDVPQSTPDLLVKASLLPVAREYSRFAFIDADVLIRDGCPDLFSLVPEDRLGAMPEGRWTDRGETCVELARMYGRGQAFPSEQYIDTGVTVMSAGHLALLAALAEGPAVAHPRDEQGFINAAIFRDAVPVQYLAREFNWIPYTPEEFDWRWAWIFHIADNWRAPPRTDGAWRMHGRGRSRIADPVPLSPRHCRLPCLIEIAEQMTGNDVRVFHPADMGFHIPMGRLLLTPDEAAAIWCEPAVPGTLNPPPIYGPYAAFEPGRWTLELLGPDGREPDIGELVLDIVYNNGNETLRPIAPLSSRNTLDIDVAGHLGDVEIRFYRSSWQSALGSIMFRRISE